MADYRTEDVDKFCERFARLMDDESDAWKKPEPKKFLETPQSEPTFDVATVSRPANPQPIPGDDEDYDSDDPEQICNARFAPQPRRKPGWNARRGSAKQQVASASPQNAALLKQLKDKVFPSLGLRIGQRPKSMITFTPWKLVVEYPFMFIGKANFEKVNRQFSLVTNASELTRLSHIHVSPSTRCLTLCPGTCEKYPRVTRICPATDDLQLLSAQPKGVIQAALHLHTDQQV
jgi:hypothetical protein